VVREEVRERPEARGRELIEVPGYTFHVLVTTLKVPWNCAVPSGKSCPVRSFSISASFRLTLTIFPSVTSSSPPARRSATTPQLAPYGSISEFHFKNPAARLNGRYTSVSASTSDRYEAFVPSPAVEFVNESRAGLHGV
jgi:hypothetical protein